MKKKEKSPYQLMMEDCPILYNQRKLPCTETCMCWGIEAGEGWLKPLTKLSKRLEDINNAWWPLLHIRVQADQVKEKYGTLHFYYTCVIDPPWYRYYLIKAVNWMSNFIRKHVKFKYERVELTPRHKKLLTTEISLDEYKQYMKSSAKAVNVTFEAVDGKIIKKTEVEVCPSYENVLKNHKILHWIENKLTHIGYSLNAVDRSERCDRMLETISKSIEEAVRTAENDCYCTCEECGAEINDLTRCMTNGYVRYLCEDCASKSNGNYQKNGDIYNNKKLIKTVAQCYQEEAAYNAKYAEQKKQQQQEADEKIRMMEETLASQLESKK